MHIVEALPLNASGKVLKTELRARLLSAAGADGDATDGAGPGS